MSWEIKKLSECCASIADGDHQAPPKADSGIPFVTISNINSTNQFDFTNTMFVPQAYYDGLDSKRKAQKGDDLVDKFCRAAVANDSLRGIIRKGKLPGIVGGHFALPAANTQALVQLFLKAAALKLGTFGIQPFPDNQRNEPAHKKPHHEMIPNGAPGDGQGQE